PDIARILPNLYISKGQISIDPAALQEHQVTSILSITTDFQPEWESPAIKKLVPIQRHLLLPADDNKVMNLLPFFASICDWIDEQIETPTTAVSNGMGDGGKNNVLVHCKAGFSRSPTICIAYLLRKMYPTHDPERDPSFEEILTDFSKTKWSRTWPKETSTFLDQLKVWFATGYQIWEDDEKRIPKKEYQRFLEK
ncbi:Protein-tyrosine phosphatase-like protein, partial [Naviculisporaceae sp. PSN 640]